MTSDAQRALLAAIVADPADDTVRLAYADCIEEHGNSARAEFIRLQIKAEHLHPDSNARAALEAQAEALFAEHWIDWWGEVCAEVGLPKPAPQSASRVGRLASRFGFGQTPGAPYNRSAFAVQPRRLIDGLRSATFCRGFPDTVHISQRGTPSGEPRHTLNLWLPEFPLASLTVTNVFPWDLSERPFAGVHTLSLIDYDQAVLHTILQSKMFPRLEDLTLFSHEYADRQGIVEEFANQIPEILWLLHGRNLKRLSVQVWTDRAATGIAHTADLASLTALDVNVQSDVGDWVSNYEGVVRRIEILSRSPHLAGLQELTIAEQVNHAAFWLLAVYASWTGLRKLTINTPDHTGCPLWTSTPCSWKRDSPRSKNSASISSISAVKSSTCSSAPRFSSNCGTSRLERTAWTRYRMRICGGCPKCSTSTASRRSGSTPITMRRGWTNSSGSLATGSGCPDRVCTPGGRFP